MGSVTVPEMVSTITRFSELNDHFTALAADPSKELDVDLLDHVDLQLNFGNIDYLVPVLLPRLAVILEGYTQNIDPLANFTTKIIQNLKIGQINEILGEEGAKSLDSLIVAALLMNSPGGKKLGLALLTACARDGPLAVQQKSQAPQLIESLIITWLRSPDAGVGSEATKTLLRLLHAHKESPSPNVWDKIFSPDCQLQIYANCVIQSRDDKPTRDQKTISQGRLLEALPHIVQLNPAMPVRSLPNTDWSALASTNDEPYPGLPDDGLLHLVVLHMVDLEDDPMVVLLVRFWEQLVLCLDSLNMDPMTPVGEKYAKVLGIVISKTSDDGKKISEALVSLPGQLEQTQDQDRISVGEGGDSGYEAGDEFDRNEVNMNGDDAPDDDFYCIHSRNSNGTSEANTLENWRLGC
ncbi:hypothetical protein MKZ38_002037 [Zalerion maritima]|uniref:Uncharacterized protein n=1 Tax=Zalerion maritima TaxID=339359 RepID=A0AAD5RZD0_9PEZI|nr:hypothetical protein MKZ38_002037 [Zalerion maritima]